MILFWLIAYLIGEIVANPTVHLDPMNIWGIMLIVSLAVSVSSAR